MNERLVYIYNIFLVPIAIYTNNRIRWHSLNRLYIVGRGVLDRFNLRIDSDRGITGNTFRINECHWNSLVVDLISGGWIGSSRT